MSDWEAAFGQAAIVLVSIVFVLSLVLVVVWQLKLLVRWGRELDKERQAMRHSVIPPTDATLPPPWL